MNEEIKDMLEVFRILFKYNVPVKEEKQIGSYIEKLVYENKQLKEQKRLILKNVKEWIKCSKCEQLEPDLVHEKYWNSFEQILRIIFKNYNTENLSDNDLKYKHYLEKENEELISQLQQKEDIINKAIKKCNKEKGRTDFDIFINLNEQLKTLERFAKKINYNLHPIITDAYKCEIRNAINDLCNTIRYDVVYKENIKEILDNKGE